MFVALRNAHFAEIPDKKPPRMRTSAMGRELPVVTLREFFALATCYAGSTGRSRPGADVCPLVSYSY
jgi:hypothetical protein